MSFVYNDEGLRVSKTVGNTTTYYVYDEDLLLAEYTDTQTVAYIYDANGSPIGFKYRSSSYTAGTWDVYWYEKNLQGDVVAIYNSIGTKLISYKYNAWGVTTKTYHSGGASTTAIHNNLTYRGYYYDTDLAMYYLQSRYYDANICRFISADAHRVIGATPECLTDKNLFAYCDNNPVMRVDYTGEFWNYIIGGIVGAITGGVSAALSGEDLVGVVINAISGAASGVIAASGLNILLQAGISAGISCIADITHQAIDIILSDGTISDYDPMQTAIETIFGFATSYVGSKLGDLTGYKITKTKANADNMFDHYLGKTFTAEIRKTAGRSSSALYRQADAFLKKSIFLDNVTQGVSSVIGSIFVSSPSVALKNFINENVF